MNRRINAVFKETAGSADGKNNIFRKHSFQISGVICKDGSADKIVIRFQQFDGDPVFRNFDRPPLHFCDQRTAHLPGSVWTTTGRTAPGIVISLVPGKLSEFIVRERDPQIGKMRKRHRGKSCFRQCQIAMNCPAPGKILRHEIRGIRFTAVHSQFIISLFIAAGIDGCAEGKPLCINGKIPDAEGVEPNRHSQTGGSAADHEGMDLSAGNRNILHLTTCRSSFRHPHQ